MQARLSFKMHKGEQWFREEIRKCKPSSELFLLGNQAILQLGNNGDASHVQVWKCGNANNISMRKYGYTSYLQNQKIQKCT